MSRVKPSRGSASHLPGLAVANTSGTQIPRDLDSCHPHAARRGMNQHFCPG